MAAASVCTASIFATSASRLEVPRRDGPLTVDRALVFDAPALLGRLPATNADAGLPPAWAGTEGVFLLAVLDDFVVLAAAVLRRVMASFELVGLTRSTLFSDTLDRR
jgi:hypothetical protein